jgi:hypothetical protein
LAHNLLRTKPLKLNHQKLWRTFRSWMVTIDYNKRSLRVLNID